MQPKQKHNNMNTNLKRRKFLRNSLLTAGGLVLAPNFISCSDDKIDTNTREIPLNLKLSNFNEGVASFDPTDSQVIIWTRYTTNEPYVSVIWQLSKDSQFKNIIRENVVSTNSDRDYTIAVEIRDLQENQKLYYRFINKKDETVSPVGETIIFGSNTSKVKLAVASCSNYAYGYFNVYELISKSDADVVIHLGDYIYEYGEKEYGSFRTPAPKKEAISLNDYRTRYKQYRTDKKLMELHRKKPFICVWDDHEVANDTYKDGAENHQPTEGNFLDRKKAALKAYGEYLPNTTNLVDKNIIYRNLKIGNLIDLIMLDTRIIGRDKQLDYANYYNAKGQFDIAKFKKQWLNPERTILGKTQRSWFAKQMAGANAKWQIIGQQVLMGKMLMPAELLPILAKILKEVDASGSASPQTFKYFQSVISQLVVIKTRLLKGDPTLKPEEIARVKTVLPYNLDAWDGYFVEREMMLSTFKGKKVAVLAGDTHNAWQSDLKDKDGNKMAVELATSSISSPGLEVYLGAGAKKMEQVFQLLIDDLNYVNTSERGFMELTVTASSINTEWIFVDTVTDKKYSSAVKHKFNM